jgi:hypothetical protein
MRWRRAAVGDQLAEHGAQADDHDQRTEQVADALVDGPGIASPPACPAAAAAASAATTKASNGWTLPHAISKVSSPTDKATASMLQAAGVIPKNDANGLVIVITRTAQKL